MLLYNRSMSPWAAGVAWGSKYLGRLGPEAYSYRIYAYSIYIPIPYLFVTILACTCVRVSVVVGYDVVEV